LHLTCTAAKALAPRLDAAFELPHRRFELCEKLQILLDVSCPDQLQFFERPITFSSAPFEQLKQRLER